MSATSLDPSPDVVVVGAGVAGLTVAHALARAGRRVVVLESSDEVGGLLRRGDLDGLAIDIGAESFATRTTGVADLIADAELAIEVVPPMPGGAHLAAMADADVVRAPLPTRTVLGIPADPLAADVVRILGPEAAARVAAERELPATGDGAEPSLADLVAERCGPELVSRLVDPLCRSVYSQPAAALRLSRVQPALWQEFQRSGSLIAAADAVASASRTGSAVAGLAGGMWRLPVALRAAAEASGATVRTGVAVRTVRAGATGVTVESTAGRFTARAVVVATGTRAAAAVLAESGETAADDPRTDTTLDAAALGAPAPGATTLDAARAERVRVVAALVRSRALDEHPVGSGVIVAPDVPSRAKALTHANAKWPWLGDALGHRHPHHHVVRMSARDGSAPGLETPADLAREIALLTGIPLTTADVVATASAVYDDAVAAPPVTPERRGELAHLGIHLAGASVAGTGLASVVPHARDLAAMLLASLSADTVTATAAAVNTVMHTATTGSSA